MADDILDTVLHYKELATSLSGCHMKDETMLQFMAYCISSNELDSEVIGAALDTLLLLTTNKCYITHLISTYGVLEALELATTRDNLPSDLKIKAEQLYEKLDCKDAPAYSTRSKTKIRCSQVELREKPKTVKIILHVYGLNKDSSQKLESTLIKIKGVVSLVLDVDHQRCILLVYPSVTAVHIAKTLMNVLNMEAKLISRNKSGHEVLKRLIANTESQDDLPPYLNEEESPVKEKAVSQMFRIKDKTYSWLKYAAGFVQESFYW